MHGHTDELSLHTPPSNTLNYIFRYCNNASELWIQCCSVVAVLFFFLQMVKSKIYTPGRCCMYCGINMVTWDSSYWHRERGRPCRPLQSFILQSRGAAAGAGEVSHCSICQEDGATSLQKWTSFLNHDSANIRCTVTNKCDRACSISFLCLYCYNYITLK